MLIAIHEATRARHDKPENPTPTLARPERCHGEWKTKVCHTQVLHDANKLLTGPLTYQGILSEWR